MKRNVVLLKYEAFIHEIKIMKITSVKNPAITKEKI